MPEQTELDALKWIIDIYVSPAYRRTFIITVCIILLNAAWSLALPLTLKWAFGKDGIVGYDETQVCNMMRTDIL